ncbi:MAG: GNAT family N-acetyltransferase [Thermodesulfobacteriota bacterium]
MVEITYTGYAPGTIGRITELHGTYYARHWQMGLFFEAKVAAELAELLGRLDPAGDLFLAARDGERIIGSIALDGGRDADGARLRFFIVDPAYQGRGVGRELMRRAMDFCRRAGHGRVYLWTFAGLDAARRLYEEFGFVLVREHPDDQWGLTLSEQMFEWRP